MGSILKYRALKPIFKDYLIRKVPFDRCCIFIKTLKAIQFRQILKNQFSGFIQRLAVIAMIILFAANFVWGQTTNDYRSNVTTGNWGTIGSWQRFNGSNWVAAASAPNSTANVITIRSGHTITVTAAVAVDQVVVEAGGQVNLTSNVTLTIANGTGDDFVVYGTVYRTTGTVTTTGTMVFGDDGTYQHARNGSNIPTATWHTNSTCLVTGVVATLPSGRNQNFGNLTWNNTAQTATTAYGALSITGNLTIQNTNSGQFNFTNASTNTVGGDFIQTGGTVRLAGNNATSLTVGGNFNLSGGTISLSYGTGPGTLNVAKNFSHTNGTITESSSGSGSIVFNGSAMQTYTSGGTVSNIINFTVNNGAYLQMAAAGTTITGNSFTLSSGATLGITSADGITTSACGTGATCGNIRTTTRTFNTGANYVYNGTSAQNTGNGLPATVFNLTFDNSGGVVTFNSARIITNNFSINSGSIANLGTYTFSASDLKLGGAGTASGSWGHASSPAINKNNDFFDNDTGIINVSVNTCSAPAAPVSGGDQTICADTPIPQLSVTVAAGETVDWYAAPSGGSSLVNGSLSYVPSTAGTFYAETRNSTTNCTSSARTGVTLNVLPVVPGFNGLLTNTSCPSNNDGAILISDFADPVVVFKSSEADYIDLGSSLLSNRSSFTIEGWVNFNIADLGSRMSLFGQNDAIEFGFISSTVINCWSASGGFANYTISAVSDGWHHVAAVGNGTNILIYIDGSQVASGGNSTSNYGASSYSAKIGGGVWDAAGGSFTGKMMKVGFWNTALSAAQISSLSSEYTFYKGTETGLIAGYNFHEGTGTSVSSLPAGTTGTFAGTPEWSNVLTFTWTKTGEAGFSASTKNISDISAGEYNLSVSNGTCQTTSSFTITSDADIPSVNTISIPSALCTGATLNPSTPSVTPNGSAISSQGWQLETTAGGGVFGSLTLPYTVTYADNGKIIRYYATNSCGTAYSNEVILSVTELPVITNQPSPLTLCEGESGNVNIATSATSPSYLWQYSVSSTGPWANTDGVAGVSGHTTDQLSITNVPLSYNNFYVSCIVTSNSCSIRSNAVLLTVNPVPTTGEIIPD